MDPIRLESIGQATALDCPIRNMGSSMEISFVTSALARRPLLHQASAMSVIDLLHRLGILLLPKIPLVWVMRRPRDDSDS